MVKLIVVRDHGEWKPGKLIELAESEADEAIRDRWARPAPRRANYLVERETR